MFPAKRPGKFPLNQPSLAPGAAIGLKYILEFMIYGPQIVSGGIVLIGGSIEDQAIEDAEITLEKEDG